MLGGCGLVIGIPDHELLESNVDAGDAGSDGTVDAVVALDASLDASKDARGDASPCDAADLASDPVNCGRCGHDCVGGGCVTGVCQAVPLAVSAGTPVALALSGTLVFWTESAGAVQFAPKDGGNASTLISTSNDVDRLAVDSTYVYYSLYNQRVQYQGIDAAAGGGTEQFLQPAMALFTRNGYVYVGYAGSGNTSGLYACTTPPNPVCNAIISALDGNAGTYFLDVKADDAGIVFSSSPNVGGAVWSCPPAGCSGPGATQLAANAGTQLNLAITSKDVFWVDTDGGAGRILHCARSNCQLSVTTIAPDEGVPRGIAADETNVYWTDFARGRVLACPLGGCPKTGPMVLAEGGAPAAIALDSTAVYFTNAVNNGTIVRVAKP